MYQAHPTGACCMASGFLPRAKLAGFRPGLCLWLVLERPLVASSDPGYQPPSGRRVSVQRSWGPWGGVGAGTQKYRLLSSCYRRPLRR
jgi:hypothetical protein